VEEQLPAVQEGGPAKPIELTLADLKPAPAGAKPGDADEAGKPAKKRDKWEMAKAMSPILLDVEKALIQHLAGMDPKDAAASIDLQNRIDKSAKPLATVLYYYMPDSNEKMQALAMLLVAQAAVIGPHVPAMLARMNKGQAPPAPPAQGAPGTR
ncbi:MAG: hypothetical protein KGH63_04280, partial [Candidatus Micrarchaeota archaeon]|nr:hypothetical protein [Candidatus Micrarchaeota archaeon]